MCNFARDIQTTEDAEILEITKSMWAGDQKQKYDLKWPKLRAKIWCGQVVKAIIRWSKILTTVIALDRVHVYLSDPLCSYDHHALRYLKQCSPRYT